MKLKKILSITMTIISLATFLNISPVFAEVTNDLTVYLSISRYGELVEDKYGKCMAYAQVDLTGKESYNMNDVFLTAHTLYFEEDDTGYASSHSQWGYGIDKFWGDTSYNFGYQVNGGKETILGLDHIVKNGDFIDAFIYKNSYPDTEGYAMFDVTSKSIFKNSDCELTLKYTSGYDENWNTIISPCKDATIIINGEETDNNTDESGVVSLNFENEGIYIISAKKTKKIGENTVPAITAPVCIINVSSPPEIKILHNIAKQYNDIDFSTNDVNLPWIISDMLTYEELFPESENVLSDEKKNIAAKTIAQAACDAERPGDLSKYILALRALGYNAKNIYTDDFKEIDVVKKLTDLIDSKDESVTNIYTVPYVIIALSQDESYATEEQMDWLIQSVIDNKEVWQNTEYGTDALAPILVSLAPYYETNEEIKSLCDETVEILKSEQREDGLIDGFEGYESASTGLAICALSSLGIDPYEVKNGDENLISGLLSTANVEFDSFSNAFATEQGFRGLLSLNLFHKNKQKIYDFSVKPMNKLNISKVEYCPVVFDVTPAKAVVTIEGVEKSAENYYDLPEATYKYSVSASEYEKNIGEFTINKEEAENHILKTITVSLSEIYSDGDTSRRPITKTEENDQEEITISTPVENTKNEEFNINTFPDVSIDDWYYNAVKYAYENKLFKGTNIGFEPNKPMSRAMLVTVLYRFDSPEEMLNSSPFSDVPEDEWFTTSVCWASKYNLVNGVSEKIFAPHNNITREQFAVVLYRYALHKGYNVDVKDVIIDDFADKEQISSYAKNAMKYATETKIINGRGENRLAPREEVTRAEAITMLMRFSEVNK